MAFENAKVNSTTFSGTTIDATGNIFSGSTDIGSVLISKRQKLIASNHSGVGLVQNSGSTTETVFEQWSYPAGYFKPGDTILFWWNGFFSSSTGTNSKTLRIRIGTAGTTSDFAFYALATTSANANQNLNQFGRFVDNNVFECVPMTNTSQWAAPLATYVSSSTMSLNSTTTYISLTATRSVLSADTVNARYYDFYLNR